MRAEIGNELQQFHWLLDQFVDNTAGVRQATAVSSDGFLLAASSGSGPDNSEQLAAVNAGLVSLTRGAAEMFGMDRVEQVLVEMARGHLFLSTISDGSALAVVADKRADLGLVGYELALMVERVGAVLSPELVHHLKNTLNV